MGDKVRNEVCQGLGLYYRSGFICDVILAKLNCHLISRLDDLGLCNIDRSGNEVTTMIGWL